MDECRGDRLGALADPSSFHGPVEIAGHEPAFLLGCLEKMLLIRRIEETIGDLVTSGEVQCPCHLCIGQEACAVGVAVALDTKRDRAFGAHRSHGHFLALGGGPESLLAEVLGRETGCCGGLGGSMHLVEPDAGLYGTVPIVAATIPIAVGAALAAKLQGSEAIAVSFFGDGATEEGVFHESMNLARTQGLGVVFVCENNLFSSHLHIDLRQPSNSVSRYAEAHAVPSRCVDGNDLGAVIGVAQEAVERARGGGGPSFLELVTYRWRGHVGPREDLDVGVRRKDDLETWKKRDPIRRLAQALEDHDHLTPAALAAIDKRVAELTRKALEKARQAPYPDMSATLQHVLPR